MDEILKCYRILGLEPGASHKAVKKAYRDLVKTWHPDQFHNDQKLRQEAEEKLKQINVAFERVQEYRASHPSPPNPRPSQPSRPYPPAPAAPSPKPKSRSTPAQSKPANSQPANSASQSAPKKEPEQEKFGNAGWRFARPVSIAGIVVIVLFGAATAAWFGNRKPLSSNRNIYYEPIVSIAGQEQPASAIRLPAPTTSVPGTIAQSTAAAQPSFAQELRSSRRTGETDGQPAPATFDRADAGAPAEIRALLIEEPMKSTLPEKSEAPLQTRGAPETESETHFRLGVRYAKGEDGLQDYSEAVKWYRLAAEAGHAGAQRNLGLLFASGTGVPQDFTEAEKWLRKAAAQGQVGADFADAIISLAKRDAQRERPKEISEPLTNAPPKENPITQYQRGLQYAKGDGVIQDFTEAAKWYRLAAEAGYAEAQKKLGFLYATGKGVPKDDAEAERWLRQAGNQRESGTDLTSALALLKKLNETNRSGLKGSTNNLQPPTGPSESEKK
jgi:TPR repeat protein